MRPRLDLEEKNGHLVCMSLVKGDVGGRNANGVYGFLPDFAGGYGSWGGNGNVGIAEWMPAAAMNFGYTPYYTSFYPRRSSESFHRPHHERNKLHLVFVLFLIIALFVYCLHRRARGRS